VRPTDTLAVKVGGTMYPVKRLSAREVIAFAEAADADEIGRILGNALDALPDAVIASLDAEATRGLIRYVMTGDGTPAENPAYADAVSEVYERVAIYAETFGVDPDVVLDRPWLDVLFYSDAALRERTAYTEQLATAFAIAMRNPSIFLEKAEREQRAKDTRTPEQIFASVCAAAERGWR
jgi:hypothetical protein